MKNGTIVQGNGEYKKRGCTYCNNLFGLRNIKKHERCCYLNPKNIKHCKVCGDVIKRRDQISGTCSRECYLLLDSKKQSCRHCTEEFSVFGIKHHEPTCYLNPKNIKHCKVCGDIIKSRRSLSDTCSKVCYKKIKLKKHTCRYCNDEFTKMNIKRHEPTCYLNPKNKKYCKMCGTVIKKYKNMKNICSTDCYYKFIVKYEPKKISYRNICFYYHEKKCVICNEDKIVAAHHYDESKDNCSPDNLIPLCPTHHSYVHSRYRDEVLDKIDKYRDNWIKKNKKLLNSLKSKNKGKK